MSIADIIPDYEPDYEKSAMRKRRQPFVITNVKYRMVEDSKAIVLKSTANRLGKLIFALVIWGQVFLQISYIRHGF